jgi:hypothetical protein
MSDKTPSADDLVTAPTARTGEAETPATQSNPDPAHALDPLKDGQPVSAPRERAKAPKIRKAAAAKRQRVLSDAEKASLVAKLAAGKARKAAGNDASASRDEGIAAYEAAVAHRVASFDKMPAKGPLWLRLGDGAEFLDGLIDVDRGALKSEGQGRVTYAKPVEIAPEGAPVMIREAWLIAATGDAVRCEVGPITGGGGHQAQIPAGHLLF